MVKSNNNIYTDGITDYERDRKAYEQNVIKPNEYDTEQITAINDSFSIRSSYKKFELLNISSELNGEEIIVPNYNFIKQLLKHHLSNYISNNNDNKKITSHLTFKIRVKNNGDDHYKYFNTEIYVLKSLKSIEVYINKLLETFTNWLNELYNADFLGLIKIDIKTVKTKNIYGGDYVELPYFVKCKKACVNIKNIESTKNGVIKYDDKCFLYCILAFYNYNEIKKVECRYYKKFLDTMKQPDNITYPISIDDIHLFEEINEFKINVFELTNENKLKIIYDSYNNNKELINLLLYNNHYIWIKDINRFEFSN